MKRLNHAQSFIEYLFACNLGNTDLIFFISMFGELFMVLFLYLYAERRVRQNY